MTALPASRVSRRPGGVRGGEARGGGGQAAALWPWIVVACAALAAGVAFADDPPGTIRTFAGGGVGDGGPATGAPVQPWNVATDADGNIYIADEQDNRIRKVSQAGIITTVAGTGHASPSPDGSVAAESPITDPMGIAVDANGNVYFTESPANRVRKVGSDGKLWTVAGGSQGFSGDGGAATSAKLWFPVSITFDSAGNLYIADLGNRRVRKVTPGGTITTVAGNGVLGSTGDGGPATSATLNAPFGLAVDASGNLFIADTNAHRIRKVSPDGTITTAVGTGTAGFSGDGGPATSAQINSPRQLALDASGNLLIADALNQRIRVVSSAGTITTVAGTGTSGFTGDGGPATAARLSNPFGLAVDGAGNIIIGDTSNSRVRRVSASGTITTIAGNGGVPVLGDGLLATSAQLNQPGAVAWDGAGRLFIADAVNNRIRRVAADGTISTVAGTGTVGFSGDGGPATAARLNNPLGVAVDGSGNLYIADWGNHRVRKVSTAGTITTFAGTGIFGFTGDGGPATAARLSLPTSVALDGMGNLFIATAGHHRVRRVDSNGTITTVAGNGVAGFSGDGGAAILASLRSPFGVAVDTSGNLFIADRDNNRIRKVDTAGTITTVAGTGVLGFSGDGGPAAAAQLRAPWGVAVDADGRLFIGDYGNDRVRQVTSDGTISTVAGVGIAGFSGDRGPATSARLDSPKGLALDASGNLFIADADNHRIRRVSGSASAASISAPAAIVQECDDPEGDGSTVHFVFDVVPGTADLLRVTDLTGSRTLLEVSSPVAQQYGIGPVVFPHGASTVSIRLLAGATEVASATVTVQIEDTLAPVLLGCEAKTIELQGPLTALDPQLLGIAAEDACDPAPAVSLVPAALALGTTTVTATARDATGNTSSCDFAVTVVDTTPPQFLVEPQDLERHCEGAETVVAFDVLAEDLSGSVTILCKDEADRTVDPSGTPFAVGEHIVTCTATDGSGNGASWAFRVTIVDDEAPVVVVPSDIVVGTDPGVSYAFIAFAVTATDECDPAATISCAAPWGPVESGDAFPVGTTTVVCTARDHAGNEASVSFSITVQDREPPVISAPASVTLTTDCAGSALSVTAASLGATATDNCDPEPSLVAAPASLPPGTTAVVVTATDEDGNASQKTVQVTVLKAPFEVRFLRPLDGNVDNVIQPGRTVPLKIRVSCDNLFEAGATAVIERVERLDGSGTPVANELVDDAGLSGDDDGVLRLDAPAEQYLYNLSTKGWATTSGTRFRVVVRVSKTGHADTIIGVVLRNR